MYREFCKEIEKNKNVRTDAYATLGLKAGSRLMLHMEAVTPDAIQLLVRDLLHTPLGAYLRVSYTLLGMTRPSPYKKPSAASVSTPDANNDLDIPLSHRYLVVYPFTKTIEWHLSPLEERRAVMKAHVDVGRRWSATVSQLLLYSYGLDDHEFIVSYYTDKLDDFQSLVMDMRGTESRRHTKNDTPIFTCIHMPIAEALLMI